MFVEAVPLLRDKVIYSSVGIATGYGLDDRGLSSPRRPDRLWGPLILLCNGYRGFFPRGLETEA
jgi:hypothetical protein